MPEERFGTLPTDFNELFTDATHWRCNWMPLPDVDAVLTGRAYSPPLRVWLSLALHCPDLEYFRMRAHPVAVRLAVRLGPVPVDVVEWLHDPERFGAFDRLMSLALDCTSFDDFRQAAGR